MKESALEVLQNLTDAYVLVIEPGCVVTSRTNHGVHGDDEDLAFSATWRDHTGYEWSADFSEAALGRARTTNGVVTLRSMDDCECVFRCCHSH